LGYRASATSTPTTPPKSWAATKGNTELGAIPANVSENIRPIVTAGLANDVELVNQTMPAAVTAFISGAVPAVALWVPFNVTVRDKVPGAVKLADASAYYPQAAIIGGWAASNDYYDANKETLAKLIKGWAEANDYIIANSSEALASLQKAHYSQTPLADINEQFKAQKMFSSHEWKRLYSDGTVTNWLQQSTDFFMANAGIKDFTPASKYFDPSLYLKTVA